MARVTSPEKLDFTNPFADVDIQPVKVAGETIPTRVAVRVKSDSGAFGVQGIVGKDYQLLPNRKVRDIAEDIMSRAGDTLGGFKNIKTLFDGRRYVDYFISNNPIAAVNNGQTRPLHCGLMSWNAYDGSRKTGFEIFALDGYCTNEYHSRNRFGYFAWRHTPDNKIDMEDALASIGKGVENIIRIAPRIEALNKSPLDFPRLIEVKAATKLPQSRWGDVLDELAKEKQTMYGLFQAMTNVASHKLTGMSALDTGTAITEYFLAEKEPSVLNHTTAAAVVAERQAGD